ncbi:hypothetical protein P7C73_g5357, partial [Tremellales sp. Uapishka_1]
MPLPKANAQIRIVDLLTEMGVSTTRLVMPTRNNIDMLERVLQAAGALMDMKRQYDRVEQELRTLRAQKEGFIPPPDGARKARSESITSTDTSGTNRRSRQP